MKPSHLAATSTPGQEDRQQERGILDSLDGVRLPRGQVEQFPGLRLAEGGEGHTQDALTVRPARDRLP